MPVWVKVHRPQTKRSVIARNPQQPSEEACGWCIIKGTRLVCWILDAKLAVTNLTWSGWLIWMLPEWMRKKSRQDFSIRSEIIKSLFYCCSIDISRRILFIKDTKRECKLIPIVFQVMLFFNCYLYIFINFPRYCTSNKSHIITQRRNNSQWNNSQWKLICSISLLWKKASKTYPG